MRTAVFSNRPPPSSGVMQPRPARSQLFKTMYDRGDIPVILEHGARGCRLVWRNDIDTIDYQHFLPVFFDGLCEEAHPYSFIARAGIADLLTAGGPRIRPCVPQLILPLKRALDTRNPKIVAEVLRTLQKLVVSGDRVGEALVLYYRQLLPTISLFKDRNINIGDQIEYGQRKRNNLGDLVQETLELLEIHGGPDAFTNIRYLIPTYDSVVLN